MQYYRVIRTSGGMCDLVIDMQLKGPFTYFMVTILNRSQGKK